MGEAAFHAGTCGEAAEYREGRKAPELPGVRVSGLVHSARPGGDRWNDSNPWIGEGMAESWEGRRGGHRTQGRQQICGRPERVSHCKSVTSCVARATFEVLVSCAARDSPVSENDE